MGRRNKSANARSYESLWAVRSNSYSVTDIVGGHNVSKTMPSEYEIPWADGSFDVVVSGQTLEHVRNPFRLFGEMGRVLRSRGYMCHVAPSSGPNHDAVDCWRWMRDSFKAVADETGFETLADWIDGGSSGGGRGKRWGDHTWVGRKIS